MVPYLLRKLVDYKHYVQLYRRGGPGGGSCKRASTQRQRVAGAKSSLALGKMLHADAYIVCARRTFTTLAMDNTRTIQWASVSYKFSRVLVCSVVRQDGGMSHVCLIKWKEKFITNEGRKI